MPEFHSSQAAMPMNCLSRERMRRNICVAPQFGEGEWRVVGAGVDRDGTGAYHAPAPLSLGLAKGRSYAGVGLGHTAGVGDLIKAIWRSHRANLYGLKKHFVAGVTSTEIMRVITRAGDG